MKDLQSLWDSASGSLDVRVSHTVELPAASEYPELSVQAFLNNNAGVYFYQGQTSFTPEQLEQDCAIAPSSVGDSLNLEGTEFPVVGRTHHFSNDVVFIPIRSFLENVFWSGCPPSSRKPALPIPTNPSRLTKAAIPAAWR